MNLRSLMFILSLAIHAPGGAGDLPPPAEADSVCPALMTEKECADHAHALSRLSRGGAREAYLVAHAEMMREREKACACANYQISGVRTAPVSHAAANRNRF